jgi:hypothetical protein
LFVYEKQQRRKNNANRKNRTSKKWKVIKILTEDQPKGLNLSKEKIEVIGY